MASQPVDVKSLLNRHQEPNAIEAQLIDILDPALNAASAPTAQTAESVARSVDDLYASGYASEDKAESLFWTLWTLYIEVAKRVPADDDARQQFLVHAIDKLRARDRGTVKVWGSDTPVWGDLSMLAPCMREAWNFTPKFDGSEQDKAAVQSWINLNSFAARLLGASVTTWTNFALWALREGLEDEPQNDAARDGYLAVAHEWIAHAGKVLYEKGRTSEELGDADRRVLKPGKLFEGEPGFSIQRWQFWRQRLETLGKDAGSEELKAKVHKTVDTMKSLEG